jgi:hypothetical protein
MNRDAAIALAMLSFAAAIWAVLGAEPPAGYAYEKDLRPHATVVTNAAQAVGSTITEAMADVTNVARSVVNTIWDPQLGVAWEARMHNGTLYYVAVTNRQEVR